MIKTVTRQIAIVALLNGIVDVGRILGVGSGDANPFDMYGVVGFALLGGFAIARIFAAVGMWIRSNWGTPLLLGVTLSELMIYLAGYIRLDIGLFGFAARLIEIVGALLILWFIFRQWRRENHD
ncbi:MAG: hypothetical protein L3J13_02465 [Devosiaceae bacterium]|nr:hypothetical protein [Devosiaceae bacterium]